MEHILLLADIHANELALKAVWSDAHNRYEGTPLIVWCLGDLFGRGPRPTDAWRRLKRYYPEHCVIGNHDWGILGRDKNIWLGSIWTGLYNGPDWEVILKHREELSNKLLLKEVNGSITGQVANDLTELPVLSSPRGGVVMVHGGLSFSQKPYERIQDWEHHLVWDYVRKIEDASYTLFGLQWLARHKPTATINEQNMPVLVLIGHYHRRTLYRHGRQGWEGSIQLDSPYELEAEVKTPVLISPGSVGFPREDFDRDASYGILRLENGNPVSITFHKVGYNREIVRQEMRNKQYPTEVINRLRLPMEHG